MAEKNKRTGPSFDIEAGLFAQGYRYIAGVDEAGRGSLAGPLHIGLVVFDASYFTSEIPQTLHGINDSKKCTPDNRDLLYTQIHSIAKTALFESVSVEDVDRLNVTGATREGVLRLLKRLPVTPDCVIIDGNFTFALSVPCIPYVKGDSLSVSIAAASIIAKVSRDRLMCSLDSDYPVYNFARHKGYGTELHRKLIAQYGPSPVHRLSYEPVKSMVEGAR